MGYNYWKQGISKGGQIGAVMSYAAKHQLSSTWTTNKLTRMGLTYRRQDMLYDFRRTGVIGLAKTLTAHNKAEDFFENIIEKIRKEHNTDLEGAFKRWEELKRKRRELEVLSKEEDEMWDIYEGLW